MSQNFAKPFEPDEHTVALYHFDEGEGSEARDACGDPALTLRARKQALWGSRPGFGSTARFERRADDANVLVGPTNNDKLHLRPCTEEWTIEAWVRYTGSGGQERGHTYANVCGTDDEGFGLPIGVRGGWNLSLLSRGSKGKLKDGITPCARFIGSPRGKDPNHDTSSQLFPYRGGFTKATPAYITDSQWHHVAWQFRYRDQTNFFFVDGKLVRRAQLPIRGSTRIIVNDAENVGVPFVVGGFRHSQDPPFFLKYGNFEGEIDELRISKIMRYPVAQKLAIIRQKLPEAGLGLPYEIRLGADGTAGTLSWQRLAGSLPKGLVLDRNQGVLRGKPREPVNGRTFTVEATDPSGATDKHVFSITAAGGQLLTESLPPAFAGAPYRAALKTKLLAPPLRWSIAKGALPKGIVLDSEAGQLEGTASEEGWATISIEVTDANGRRLQRDLVLKVLPRELQTIRPDEHTVVLYDWQGPDGRLIHDRMGDEALTLTWTNMGGDRRLSWPGREGRFPQDTGRGEHGWATAGKGIPKLDLKTCDKEWTVEAWARRGGPFLAFGDQPLKRFHYGHICGSYDTSERGVWELYLSDTDSHDGSMAPGVHFFGAEPDQALRDLHPWKRPEGIVGGPAAPGIRDTEWHHVAWQYSYALDTHQLFLDGRLIWQMKTPDGRKLVNSRRHDAQFSVIGRLKGYARYGGNFNYLGFGHFFGQVGEIRISSVRRYR